MSEGAGGTGELRPLSGPRMHSRRLSPVEAAMRMCRELVDIPGRDEYIQAASRALRDAIGGECAFWTSVDLSEGQANVVSDHLEHVPLLTEAISTPGPPHPMISSYMADPSDLRPRRVSDVIDATRWRNSHHFAAFRPLKAHHQMSVAVAVAPAEISGWGIIRDTPDFTGSDVEIATAVLPLLTALDRRHRAPSTDDRVVDLRSEASAPPLTPREIEVLELLPTGATATAIARKLGIRPSTVRKHLERIYAKLDRHDRLLVVEHSRDIGLIPRASRALSIVD